MRKLKIILCFFFIATVCLSQSQQTINGYDLKKTRLLIQTVGLFFFTCNQGAIDLDSAMIFAAKGEQLNVSLWYDEDYNNGSPLPAQQLIAEDKVFPAASLLQTLHNEDKILLLLQLGGWYLHQTGTEPDDMSKALSYLHQAVTESEALHNYRLMNAALNLLGNYAVQAGDTVLSGQYFLQASNVCKKMNNKFSLANTIDNQAVALSNYNSSKTPLLYQALNLYRQLNEKEKQIKVLGELAGVYFIYGKSDSVTSLTEQSITLQNAIGFKHTHYSHNVLAYIYNASSNPLSALTESNTSISVMEANHDTLLATYLYLMQAQVYLAAQRDNEEALNIFYKIFRNYKEGPILWYPLFFNSLDILQHDNKCNEALQLIQDVTKKYPPRTEMDKMCVEMHKGVCYQKLHQYSNAEKYWLNALQAADKIKTPEMDRERANVYSLAATFYTEVNQYYKAIIYMHKAETFMPDRLWYSAKLEIEQVKYKVDSARGNYLSALQQFQKFTNYSDSLFNLNLIKASNDLLVKYETEKKEKDIQLLNGKSKLQQTELAKTTLVKNMTLAGVAVLLIIIALIYNQYRINKKNTKEISLKNEKLNHLLNEKEWLLKEVHHRVKNNLHIITSLLESQSAYVKNDALTAIRDSQHRVYAMALIHQKLYQFEEMQTITCSEYLKELVKYLKESFDVKGRIEFVFDIAPIKLDVSQAIPIGLIVNEAVTNAVKYAFSENYKGQITISLELLKTNDIVLIVSDNGVGLPKGFNIEKINSLGMKLIKGLSDDLEGSLSIETNNGTCIKVVFRMLKMLYEESFVESAQTTLT